MGGDAEPMMKSGNCSVRNMAPTSRELEFWAGNMMTPAPGMASLPQEAIPTYATYEISFQIGQLVRSVHTVWNSNRIRDKERNKVWLTVLMLGSRWRSGMKVQSGGVCRLTHACISRRIGRP
jgi:hypothetical protein